MHEFPILFLMNIFILSKIIFIQGYTTYQIKLKIGIKESHAISQFSQGNIAQNRETFLRI